MMQSYVGISASTLANNLPTAAGADPTFLDDQYCFDIIQPLVDQLQAVNRKILEIKFDSKTSEALVKAEIEVE